MRLTKIVKIGQNKYPFSFEGDTFWDCVMESQKLSFFDVHKCGDCESDSLRLFAYRTEGGGYKYVKIICNKCNS